MAQRRFELDAVGLEALEGGEGGAPLLLIHGFTGAKEDFADEVEPLAALGYHVVVPDLRGHGQSSAPAEESAYGLQIFADDMFALADTLGWPRFDVLGHSMGGMVAQLMVLQTPERIDRLVLMDTHHGVVEDLDVDLVKLGIELARTQGLEVIQQLLKMGRDPLANPAYERVKLERPGHEAYSDAKMLACSPAMYAAMLGELITAVDRLAELGSIRSPTLVQVGELDAGFRTPSKEIADAIEGARLDVLANGGHSPQFEATALWRESLHGFLGARGE
jgi:pimeloyl-ACP methyl ester carboxylesterase